MAPYTVPTRNASTLGYGLRRRDGRLSERRRPASSTLPNQMIRQEALAIPYGTGTNLDDRQKMILCYLPNEERHKRATQVFNTRGEWYSKYTYMTTKDDAFLAMCDMPRIYVPRGLGDRPGSRNMKQLRLEEEYVARRCAGVGFANPQYPTYTYHSTNHDVPNGMSVNWPPQSTYRDSLTLRSPAPIGVDGPIELDACLIPDLIEEDVSQYLWADAMDNVLALPILVDVKSMSFQDVCAAIMKVFNLNRKPFSTIPEMYVGTVLARWTEPVSGKKDVRKVFEHNWKDEIAWFITHHPAGEVDLGFGLALAEEDEVVSEWDDDEDNMYPMLGLE